MDPINHGVRPRPRKVGFLKNIFPSRVLAQGVMSYLFGNGRTRQKNVGSRILIFHPWPKKMGPEDGACQGATKILEL